MSDDPAKVRFIIISMTRLFGVFMVLAGVVIVAGKTSLPASAGYVLAVLGMFETFALPQMLARRWKSPGE